MYKVISLDDIREKAMRQPGKNPPSKYVFTSRKRNKLFREENTDWKKV